MDYQPPNDYNNGQNPPPPYDPNQQPGAYPPPAYGAPVPPPYGQPAYGPVPTAIPGKGAAVASMVLGIVSLVFCWWLFFLGLPCGVVGLILGIVGKKQMDAARQPSGMAVGGLIMSIVGIVVSMIYVVTCIAACSTVSSYGNALGGLSGLF